KGIDEAQPPYATDLEAADCGTREFPRFAGGPGEYNPHAIEPNAVVKAFMPFMRRFRSEADWRDWIACGMFNWRAIYITPLGAQSEFRKQDEGDLLNAIPAQFLRDRLKISEPISPPEVHDGTNDAGVPASLESAKEEENKQSGEGAASHSAGW